MSMMMERGSSEVFVRGNEIDGTDSGPQQCETEKSDSIDLVRVKCTSVADARQAPEGVEMDNNHPTATTTEPSVLTTLPTEIFQVVFEWYQVGNRPGVDSAYDLRHVCKRWCEIVTPLLFKTVFVHAHLYYLDRLSEMLEASAVLRSARSITINTHGVPFVALMFFWSHYQHGFTDLVKERYVLTHPEGFEGDTCMLPRRDDRIQELEIEALLKVLRLMDRLESAELILDDAPDKWASEDWGYSDSFDELNNALPGYVDYWEHDDDDRNWHFQSPTLMESVMCALARFPKIKDVHMTQLPMSRIVELNNEESRGSIESLTRAVSSLKRLSLTLTLDPTTHMHDDDNSQYNTWEPFASSRAITPGILIRSASNCVDFKLACFGMLLNQAPDERERANEAGKLCDPPLNSSFEWCLDETCSPALPKVKTLYLAGLAATPDELLSFLTFHCPSLENLKLRDVHLLSSSPFDSQRGLWLTFFKALRAQTGLLSLEFRSLFNHDEHNCSWNEPTSRSDFEAYLEWKAPPKLYAETIKWFLDRTQSDSECPLNDSDIADTIGTEQQEDESFFGM